MSSYNEPNKLKLFSLLTLNPWHMPDLSGRWLVLRVISIVFNVKRWIFEALNLFMHFWIVVTFDFRRRTLQSFWDFDSWCTSEYNDTLFVSYSLFILAWRWRYVRGGNSIAGVGFFTVKMECVKIWQNTWQVTITHYIQSVPNIY